MHNHCKVIEQASKTKKNCQFPFIFKNKTYHGCTKTILKKPWCSTKTDPSSNEHITGQRVYGICDSSCPMNECQVKEKASNSFKDCQFPFIFKGITFYGCTKKDVGNNDSPWCSTKVDPVTKKHISGQSFFGDCSSSCPMNNLQSKIDKDNISDDKDSNNHRNDHNDLNAEDQLIGDDKDNQDDVSDDKDSNNHSEGESNEKINA